MIPRIAEDEARHAELAWRTVAWALRTGGADVRAAVLAVFAEINAPAGSIEAHAEPSPLLAHGRLSSADVRLTAERGLRELVLPGARALFATGETASLDS